MQGGEGQDRFYRAVGWTIERAIIEHEQRMHGRGGNVLNLPPPAASRAPTPGSAGGLDLWLTAHRPPGVSDADVDAVNVLAERLARESGSSRPPVNANIVGLFDPGRPVRVQELPLGHERGDCRREGDGWVIRVNSAYGPRSRRFILLREGFCILRETGAVRLQARQPAAVGWLADRFAAHLLMPEGWVRETWPRVRDLVNMAGIFQVSQAAMRIRLKELGLLG